MDLDLTGKRAIVCGSTQGIGKATAMELAALGANVTLVARNEQRLQTVVEELPTLNEQNHQFLVADFDDAASLSEVIEGHISAGNRAEILINNTGGPKGGPIAEAEIEEFLHAFNNHLVCNQLLVQKLLPAMKEAAYGRIVNIISTSVRQPIVGLGVSNTTRGAVASWAKTLSLELAHHGITVNNVLPGFTKTARLDFVIKSKADQQGKSISEVSDTMMKSVPAGRFGLDSEVASVAAFLATPAASYVNGVSIPVDGGRTSSI